MRQMPKSMGHLEMHPLELKVDVCCYCGSHGRVKMEATFDKTAYNQREVIKVRLHVDNT